MLVKKKNTYACNLGHSVTEPDYKTGSCCGRPHLSWAHQMKAGITERRRRRTRRKALIEMYLIAAFWKKGGKKKRRRRHLHLHLLNIWVCSSCPAINFQHCRTLSFFMPRDPILHTRQKSVKAFREWEGLSEKGWVGEEDGGVEKTKKKRKTCRGRERSAGRARIYSQLSG